VRIRYKVVQDYLRQKFIGEVIKKEENGKEGTEYAEVLALSLNKSPGENSHMVLHLQIRTLTSFFKNKILRIKMLVSLQFNEDEQELFVDDFSLDGENNSWIVNKFLQVLTNTIMYSSFREKMRFSFKNLLQERSADLNQKLKDHLEAFSGIYLKGNIHQFKVNEIIPGKDFLVVSISLSGNIIVDIENSGFL
jgi:hypothetical protein